MTRTDMFLILGLGNPGPDYAHTRHNVGFDVVDALATACVGAGPRPRPSFRVKRPLHAEILECAIGEQRVILAKPTTFMNESGRAASALVKKYSLSLPARLHAKLAAGSRNDSQYIVVHDDLDLPVGTARLSESGSSGGHKGIQSIIESLGTKDFLRLRIGIGPNTTPDGTRIPAEDFVLKRFAKSERPQLDAAVARAVEVLEMLVQEGVEAAKRLVSTDTTRDP